MKFKKGLFLKFKNRTEVIKKASNNSINGIIVTNKNTYSVAFINRWLQFGFVKLLK